MSSTETKIGYNTILVVKLSGPKNEVLRFLYKLKDIYTQDRLNMSPILKNSADDGFHCFINILPTQEPVQSVRAED